MRYGERLSTGRALSICPRCKERVLDHSAYGESQIYRSMHRLCFPCWEAEDAEITEAGSNNLPDTLTEYGPENDFD